jgi:hypothetical protein
MSLMFVETITTDREEWETIDEKLRMREDPPAGLVASVTWDAGNGQVTVLNVWDEPGQIADFYVERAASVFAELGQPTGKPKRHGEPVAVYIRS